MFKKHSLVLAFMAAALSLGGVPPASYAQTGPDTLLLPKSPVKTLRGLTAEQLQCVTDAKIAYQKALGNRDPETDDFSTIFAFQETVFQLKNAGFDIRKGEGFELLGTTKAKFDAAALPFIKRTARLYHEWSHDKEHSAEYRTNCLAQLESMFFVSGYDMDAEATYKLFDTTRDEYRKDRKSLYIEAAREMFGYLGQENAIPDACLYNAKADLRRAGFDLTKEDGYLLLGTTKAEFEALEKKYNVIPQLTDDGKTQPQTPAPTPSY